MDIHSFWFQIRSKLNLSKALKIRLLTVNRVFLTYYSAHTIWIYERWKLRTVCSWVTVVCPSLAFTRWNDNRIQNGCLTFSGIVTCTWLIRSAMFEYWSNTFNMLSAFYPPPPKKNLHNKRTVTKSIVKYRTRDFLDGFFSSDNFSFFSRFWLMTWTVHGFHSHSI